MPTASTARSAALRTVLLHRPGAELEAADAAQQRPAAVRRHPLGRPRAGGARRVRRRRCATAASRCSTSPSCSQETLEYQPARAEAIAASLADPRLGDQPWPTCCRRTWPTLAARGPRPRRSWPGCARGAAGTGRAWSLTSSWTAHDFVIDPLPNLLFTRDSSVWVGDQVAVTSLAMPARRRETALTRPDLPPPPALRRRPAAVRRAAWSTLEGGDVLLLAPGVVAVGVGERTTPAGVERLARRGVRRRARAHRAGRPDRAGARHDAPGHHLHDGRRRRDRDVPGGRRLADRLHASPGDGGDLQVVVGPQPFLRRPPPGDGHRHGCA